MADPGSALVTITGAVRAPGVYELAFGTPMSDLLAAAGGPSEPLQALLVGGYFGTWVDARGRSALRLAREDLRSVGCSLGSGVLIALGESACGLHESARVIAYLADQSAGQCGPCLYGLRAIADAVGALADGVAHPSERARVLRWRPRSAGAAPVTTPTGRCGSSRARCACSMRMSSRTGAGAAWPGRPDCRSVDLRWRRRGRARVLAGVLAPEAVG